MAKKIGIAVLVLLVAVAVVLGVLWMRLTALPDWYEDPDMIAEDGSPRVDRDWVQIPSGEPHAGGYVLRNPHLRAESTTPLQKAIKQSRATYEDGDLEAGAVLNLSEMDMDSLSAEEREQYQKSIDAFPALTGRDVYVGIEGGVAGGDGKLTIGSDTKLKIGDTSYSLASAAKKLGMSEAELRASIEKELARMDVQSVPGR
jgi:Flp pilus assembly protein CpaB